MRPKSVVNFERLYLGALVLSLVNTIMSWDRTREMLARRLGPVAGSEMGPTLLLVSVAIGVLISLLLWYFVARRGSVVAKWIVTLFCAYNVLMFLLAMAQGDSLGGTGEWLGLVTMLLNLGAVWMLFRPDARAWFASEGR